MGTSKRAIAFDPGSFVIERGSDPPVEAEVFHPVLTAMAVVESTTGVFVIRLENGKVAHRV
ncbi:MAG TPA: hypothetical protein VMV20_07845 [Chitinophagaceae bacterium]|nr:hypothetical protein [Chitinophagaceae bacterium]